MPCVHKVRSSAPGIRKPAVTSHESMSFYKVEVVQRRWYTVEVEADSESEAESIALVSQSDWEDGEHESVEEVEEITQLAAHGLTY
jgi:hypothetical protein